MKIIKTPPAPESPLGYLFGAQESTNALARSIFYRKELNNQLTKLKDKGASNAQIESSKYYYKYTEVKDWADLTKVFSIILEEVKGRPAEEKFEYIAGGLVGLFTDNEGFKKSNDEAIRAEVKGRVKIVEMTEAEKDARFKDSLKR